MLSSFIRMRQISSGYLPYIDKNGIEQIMTFPHNPKTEWISDFLQQSPTVQIIIFHEFTYSGKMLCSQLAEAGVSHDWLYGGTPNTAEVVRKFNSGETRMLVANTAKGSMAIDLPQADYIIFYESPTSCITRLQAEARPMSRGSKMLLIDDMIASNTDARILSFIKEGRSLMDSLVHNRHLLKER